jgi:glycosyltransferase involved in cell wall biosynthesis
MRVLAVVQRYGQEVAGGAELLCRQLAIRLGRRGHDVEVLTSCAVSYVDWRNHYSPGSHVVEGITVHRLPVERQRQVELFGPLNGRTVWGRKPVAFHMQQEWMRMQGPVLPELAPWLHANAAAYDGIAFFTYLYYPTWAGLPIAAGAVPTVLHPTAHDEPAFYLPLFETSLRHPTAFAFSTEEERDLVQRRCRTSSLQKVIGIGFDAPVSPDPGRFRARFGLGDDPFLLFVGRVDAEKGSDELYDFFVAYKERHPGPLRLVIVGEPVKQLMPHRDVVQTGFVDEQAKHDAYAGALLLVQPSYFESFSMVLGEAWLHGLPAVVQGHCDVLTGQVRRSSGGVPYRGFGEFEAAVELLVEHPPLRARLGGHGRRYVQEHYSWNVVLDRYEDLLQRATNTPARRGAL